MKMNKGFSATLSLITIGLLAFTTRAVATTDNYAENFEGYGVGDAVTTFTDSTWTSTLTNSVIVATNYTASYQGGAYPISYDHTSSTKALWIDDGVTNTIVAGASGQSNWLDVVVNPVFSATAPDMVPVGTVAAVYFNTNGNPVVMHTPTNTASAVWVTVANTTVSEGDWIRLSIVADFASIVHPLNPTKFYEIYINEVALSNEVAFASPNRVGASPAPDGTWFGNRRANNETSPFTSVTVRGTGYMDDLVVTNALTFTPATPAAPSYIATLPTVSELTEGDTLGDAVLTGGSATNAAGAAVAGSFAFETPSTTPAVGTNSHNVVFTPTDTGAYLSSTGQVDVVVVAAVTANGTPHSWYDQFLPTASNTYEELDTIDSDFDGVVNWMEYMAGTRPNDIESVFKLIGFDLTTTNVTLKWIGGTNGPVGAPAYVVQSVDTLGGGSIGWTNMPNAQGRLEGTNVWSQEGAPTMRFFRVRATD